jgi:hypothetical protein
MSVLGGCSNDTYQDLLNSLQGNGPSTAAVKLKFGAIISKKITCVTKLDSRSPPDSACIYLSFLSWAGLPWHFGLLCVSHYLLSTPHRGGNMRMTLPLPPLCSLDEKSRADSIAKDPKPTASRVVICPLIA